MKTYDVHFNDSNNSNNKGFHEKLEYCKAWINGNKGTSYFTDYISGIVSIVCNETSQVVYEEEI